MKINPREFTDKEFNKIQRKNDTFEFIGAVLGLIGLFALFAIWLNLMRFIHT